MSKKNKFKLGLVHGVFDVLHIGHIEHFREAKKLCEKLIVSVTSDKFVNKGPNRPAFDIKERVNVLKSLKFIDDVIISNNETAIENINKIKPNVYFKGLDYKNVNLKSANNLKKEILELKKYNGKFIVTKTKLNSSSKILNENFGYLKKDIKDYLQNINKTSLINRLKESLLNNTKNIKKTSHILIGEPILDKYTKVKILGKSQKSSVISTAKLKSVTYGGGSILILNFLSDLLNKITFYGIFNNNVKSKISHYLKKSNKIYFRGINDKNEKIIQKERFIDNYSQLRLFQNNVNEKFSLEKKLIKLFNKKFFKVLNSFKNIIIFDYGYYYLNENLINTLNRKNKTLFINCQTNSSNYGFNLFDKYKKAEILCVDEMELRLNFREKNKKVEDVLKDNLNFFKRYKIFIVTAGSKGCYIVHSNKIKYIPTFFNTTLDTTGCGDIFFSFFTYLYCEKKYSLDEIAILSHLAAGNHGLTEGNKNVFSKEKFFQIAQSYIK
jgi:rfaE bifunctional protein nucleotidyltransferase chain/domain